MERELLTERTPSGLAAKDDEYFLRHPVGAGGYTALASSSKAAASRWFGR